MLNLMKPYEGKLFFLLTLLFMGLMIQLFIIKAYSLEILMPTIQKIKSRKTADINNIDKFDITPKEQAVLTAIF